MNQQHYRLVVQGVTAFSIAGPRVPVVGESVSFEGGVLEVIDVRWEVARSDSHILSVVVTARSAPAEAMDPHDTCRVEASILASQRNAAMRHGGRLLAADARHYETGVCQDLAACSDQAWEVNTGTDTVLADTAAVADLMHALGQTVRTTPTTDITDTERVLRARLVLEEALEFVEAMGCEAVTTTGGTTSVTKESVLVEVNPAKQIDLVEATDAMADIIVVTKGSAHTLGVPVDEATRIVHGTNMAKVGGPVRADGKGLKPEGWVPPTEALRVLLERR